MTDNDDQNQNGSGDEPNMGSNDVKNPSHDSHGSEETPLGIEIGTNPHIHDGQESHDAHSEAQPPQTGWRDKIKSTLARLKPSKGGASGHSVMPGGEPVPPFERIAQKLEEWKVREKLAKVLPAEMAKSLPRSFEPIALAEWASQAFQKDAVSFYGKGITIVVCAYFLADVTSLLVEKFIPDPPVPRSVHYTGKPVANKTPETYDVIATRNLFNSSGKTGEPTTPGQNEDLTGPPQKSSLPLNLVGTLILRDEIKSIATIEDKSTQMVYPVRVEDEIPTKVRILKIEPRRVIFVNTASGRREYIELPEDAFVQKEVKVGKPTASKNPGIEQVSPNHFNIARTTVDKALADINQVLTQARAVPNFENGQPAGYKLFQIVPGSIFDALGLKNGDTIVGLNGQPVNDPGKAFELLGELKTAKSLELGVKRDGRTQNNQYDFR